MTQKILVADDDPSVAEFIEMTLKLEGFEPLKARNGEQALKTALEDAPELILLDVMMPGKDGFEILRQLRANPITEAIPVIILTAKNLSSDKVVGLTAGADDYILKPFDPMELVARVKSTLKRSRGMREASPLTGLPGNLAIVRELENRVLSGELFALMHVDLDNFKAFNDHYGFMRGDQAIKLVARILRKISLEYELDRFFVGHIGGDDFVVVCDAVGIEDIAKNIIESFDEGVPALYDPEDAQAGFVVVKDRRGEVQKFPLMTISIGIVTNVNRKFNSYLEASEIAGEMKQFAKQKPTSWYSIDRRTD